MVLFEEDIKEILTTPRNVNIRSWRDEYIAMDIFVNGGDVSSQLERIKNYENEAQESLRKNIARSTKDTVSYITKPLSKVFTATGSSIEVTARKSTQDNFKDYINMLPTGMSISKWMQTYWLEAYLTDPNGIILVEANSDGDSYPTYKNINIVHDYIIEWNKIQYLVLDVGFRTIDDSDYNVFRVIDDEFDALYYIKNDELVAYEGVGEPHAVVNTLGEVPAVVVSDIVDSKTSGRKSFLHPISEMLTEYMRDSSVHSIYKFLHGYPIFWHIASKCPTCNGEGKVLNEKYVEGGTEPRKKTCPTCKGKRLKVTKDVSDGVQLAAPTNQNSPILSGNQIAGYIQPDLDTWKMQKQEMKEMERSMHFATWGTHVEDEKSNTATGRYIDAEPVNDVLRNVSDTVEKKESDILRFIAKWSFNDISKVVSTYGKRFMIETPDVLWEKYVLAKQNKAPISGLDYLYKQFLRGEYYGDNEMLEQKMKEFFLEPFPHYSIDDIVSSAHPEQIQRKLLFSDWMNQEIDLSKSYDLLQEEFNQYVSINEKITEVPSDGQGGGDNQ